MHGTITYHFKSYSSFIFSHLETFQIQGTYLKKIKKTGEFSIKVPFSWTHRTQNISKNQKLYPQQSQITWFTLPWEPCIKNLCVFVKTNYVNCIKITHQCNFSSTISWNFFGTFLVCIIFAILALHTLKEKQKQRYKYRVLEIKGLRPFLLNCG